MANDRDILLEMARALLRDLQEIQQKGAGYYTTAPFVKRYNILVEKTQSIFSDTGSQLLDTFGVIEDTNSVDPMDKMKVSNHVIVEAGQLIAFMESAVAADATVGGENDEDVA